MIVDPSSLIFVAIIAIWAAYLLGHWVRRRDQLVTARSIDRFSNAMRVLERRGPAPLARPVAPTYVVTPARVPARPVGTAAAVVAPALVPARSGRTSAAVVAPPPSARTSAAVVAPPPSARTSAAVVAPAFAWPPPARTSARVAAVRRRTRLLAALVAVTLASWSLVVLAVLPWWGAAAVSGLLIAMVARLRSTARRQRRRAAVVQRRANARAGRRDVRQVVGQVVASREQRLACAVERAAAVTTPTAAPAPEPHAEPKSQTAQLDGGWSPVPVPPPTYTLKPKAPTVVRPVAAPVAESPAAFDLDEILERRIASGA